MSTAKEVTKIMGVMAHAYPRYELSADSVKLYAQLLADIPADVLEASAKQLMVEMKFFPSIAEWREKAQYLMVGIQNIPSAFEAWGNAIAEINRCGDYTRYAISTRTPEYSHPLVEKAVNIIGYRNLAESENEVADRAHFFKIYESLLSRAEEELKLLPEVRAVSDKYALGIGNLAKKLEGAHD